MINVQKHIDELNVTKRILNWKIDGQFIHGIHPNTFLGLTAERICELYNVEISYFKQDKNI